MSKKGRLKIEHLSLKGKQSKTNIHHSTIIIPSKFCDKYNIIKQSFDINNEKSESLIKVQELLHNFIKATSLKQQIQSFKQLIRLNWNESIPSVIGCEIFELSLLLSTCSLSRDFIKILCRLLDKLYDSPSIIINNDILVQSLLPIFDSMINEPQLYYVDTLTKLLSCSFLSKLQSNKQHSILIWRILKLLTKMLNELLLNESNSNCDSINYYSSRLPQNKVQRLSLFGRDIVAAFWLFLTHNSVVISLLFNNEDNIIVINLLKTCHELLCISSFHKDAITKIAFLQHLLITYIYADHNQQIGCFKRIVHTLIHDDNDDDVFNWNNVYSLSKMGFVRAIITQSHIDILQFELIEICFDIIINVWYKEKNPNTTLYLFDTICGWINTNYNILNQTNKNKELDDYLKTFHLKLQSIHEIIEGNWEHPSRAISFVIETMYSRYIQLMDLYNTIMDNSDDEYWMKCVENAMCLSINENGKYLRLKVLIKRVGALTIFNKYPDWIMMLLEASSIVGGNAMSLAQESLNLAKQELKSIHKWRELWMDSVCKGFVHCNESVRRSTNTDLLKYLIRADPSSYFPLIQHISKSNRKDTTSLRAFIGILRSGKRNGTITNNMLDEWLSDDDDITSESDSIMDRDLMFKCLLHNDIQIRMETLDIICASKLSTNIPGINQLELLRSILPYSMKLQMSKHRDQFVQLIQKLLLRMKHGCYKILHEMHKKLEKKLKYKDIKNDIYSYSEECSSETSSVSLFTHWNDILQKRNDTSQRIFNELDPQNQDKIINCLDFIEWFREFLLNELYPSSPIERVSTSITLYYFLLQIWALNVSSLSKKACQQNENDKTQYNILQIPLLVNDAYIVDILLNCMMNSRDQIRLLSAKILQLLPCPLPGYDTETSVIGLIVRCLVLSTSPRLLESDCGALMLAVIFDKYTKCLYWSFDLLCIFKDIDDIDNKCIDDLIHKYKNEEEAMLAFLVSFNEILSKHISIISVIPFHERYRSPHHRVHGLLTFLREIIPNLDLKTKWKSSYKLHSKWKAIFENILKNIFEIGEISLILHTRNPKEKCVENTNVKLLGIDCRGHMTFEGLNDYFDQQNEQMIVVSSWLSVKESCLCLAKFIEYCPLPQTKNPINVINTKDIEKMGSFFIKILQTTRHNGVIEKSSAGFTVLCRCLLGSGSECFSSMVIKWLNELLNIVKNDAEEHWIRRSAGFPFSILGILCAESKVVANDKVLFKYTMEQLLIEAKRDDCWHSKVVSLNILMFIFRNSAFSLSVIPFISSSFCIVLPGFSHKEWAVRNSSMLCLSAIMSRAIRKADKVMKVQNIKTLDDDLDLKQYINRNNEENEFFEDGLLLNIEHLLNIKMDGDNYNKTEINPCLHSFLLKHLNEATKDDSNMHPSLFPVLLLLSKLKNPHGLSAFKSCVIKCSSHKYERVRIMSSRALTSLISKDDLIPFLKELISQLPQNVKEIKSMNTLDGLLLQIEYILLSCYRYIPTIYNDNIWIIHTIIPILIHKLWILNSISIAPIVQQRLVIVCISVLHRILIIQHNDDVYTLSSHQSEVITLFLMRIYTLCLTLLSNKGETKNDIHSRRQSKVLKYNNNDADADDAESESDPEFYHKIKQELQETMKGCTDNRLDIGQRRLRSFTSSLLIESLLLSPSCSMDCSFITSLICVLLKDSDELVVQSTANCLCSVVNHYKAQQKEEWIMNKVNWEEIVLICMNLMKWSLWLKRRLSSIIQLFETIIQFNHKYVEINMWNVTYQIAANNCHFVVKIAATQCLGTIIHILSQQNNLNKSILKNWIIILDEFSEENTAEELRSVVVKSIEYSHILLPQNNEKRNKNEIIEIWMIMIRLLQDFELPIRYCASKYISFLFKEQSFEPNYCINLVINYLSDEFMCTNLLNKLLHFIVDPNVYYTKWIQKQKDFKLFLPERPNDAFEPLLTMQITTNALLKYVECNNDFDVVTLINGDIINRILSDLEHITNIYLNKKSIGKVMDAQMQLVWMIWMLHWFSLLYCYQIISTSINENQQRFKLCAFVMNQIKSQLKKVQNCCNSIITTFCQRYLLRLQNSNDPQSLLFLC